MIRTTAMVVLALAGGLAACDTMEGASSASGAGQNTSASSPYDPGRNPTQGSPPAGVPGATPSDMRPR